MKTIDGRKFQPFISRHTFRLMSLSSTKSSIGFRFVALLASKASPEDSLALEGFLGGKPGLSGKFLLCKGISTGESGEALNRLCEEARPVAEAPRGDD